MCKNSLRGSLLAYGLGRPEADGFHPDLGGAAAPATRNRVRHVRAGELDDSTAQSEGMRRFAALSGASVGTEKLWMGETVAAPGTVSANHHHGESETAIFIRRGHPHFVFFDGE